MATTTRTALATLVALLAVAFAASDTHAQQVDVGGVVYSQYGLQLADEADNANAFDVTRAYLNFRSAFDGGISTRVTGDIHREANGDLSYRLKYAYFTWTPEESPVTFKLGQIHTPWVDWEEGLWGYRMQGTIALDRYGYLTSSDLGVGVDGDWSEQKLNMQVVVVNGEGYHAAEGDEHKDAAARLSYRLLDSDDEGSRGGLRLTGLAHVGTFTGGGARRRLVGMLSYKSSRFTLAGEVGRATNGVPDGTDGADVDADVLSFFGVVNMPDSKLALLGRVDLVDPDTNTGDDGLTHLIAGISYRLNPHVRLLADLDHTSYQGDPPTDAAAARRSTLFFHTEFTF